MARAEVAAVKCDSYDPAQVQSAVDRAFGLLGGLDGLVRGKCLLKPNLLGPSPPSAAITTHPAVVEAVGRAVKVLGFEVCAGDSPGRGDTMRAAEATGVADACRRAGIRVVAFDEEVNVKHPAGRVCKEFVVAREVAEAAAIVNIPKMKTHGFLAYTGAVKNLLGCIPGTRKASAHLRYPGSREFSLMLLDLLALLKPAVSVLDAIVAMDRNGPSQGRPRRFGAVLASTDAVALDIVALHLARVDPMLVPYLRAARELGVGQTRLQDIDVAGDPLETLAVDDFQMPESVGAPALLRFGTRIRKLVTAVPSIERSTCTGCGECVRSCPPQAVTVSAGKASIDYSSCIRCYCCHEMCPDGAVRLSRGRIARLTGLVLDAFDRR
jgi:uncharacterized protein (DUF362 family)/Pyruvate/2-oxoacid:ferredoxin oxidoreductase delta subunit